MADIRVLGARVLVEAETESNVLKSGIILPGEEKQKSKGRVLKVGEGALLENGTRATMLVKPGDIVIYTDFSGAPIEVEGKTFIILNERDILAVVE